MPYYYLGGDVNKIGLTIIYMCGGAHYAMLREKIFVSLCCIPLCGVTHPVCGEDKTKYILFSFPCSFFSTVLFGCFYYYYFYIIFMIFTVLSNLVNAFSETFRTQWQTATHTNLAEHPPTWSRVYSYIYFVQHNGVPIVENGPINSCLLQSVAASFLSLSQPSHVA